MLPEKLAKNLEKNHFLILTLTISLNIKKNLQF